MAENTKFVSKDNISKILTGVKNYVDDKVSSTPSKPSDGWGLDDLSSDVKEKIEEPNITVVDNAAASVVEITIGKETFYATRGTKPAKPEAPKVTSINNSYNQPYGESLDVNLTNAIGKVYYCVKNTNSNYNTSEPDFNLSNPTGWTESTVAGGKAQINIVTSGKVNNGTEINISDNNKTYVSVFAVNVNRGLYSDVVRKDIELVRTAPTPTCEPYKITTQGNIEKLTTSDLKYYDETIYFDLNFALYFIGNGGIYNDYDILIKKENDVVVLDYKGQHRDTVFNNGTVLYGDAPHFNLYENGGGDYTVKITNRITYGDKHTDPQVSSGAWEPNSITFTFTINKPRIYYYSYQVSSKYDYPTDTTFSNFTGWTPVNAETYNSTMTFTSSPNTYCFPCVAVPDGTESITLKALADMKLRSFIVNIGGNDYTVYYPQDSIEQGESCTYDVVIS